MKRAAYLIAVAGLLMCGAAAADSPGKVSNEMCPVLTDQHIDPEIFTDYEGQRVYFCCPRCKKKFIENPAAYMGNLPQFASNVHSEPAPDHDAAHVHGAEADEHKDGVHQPEADHDDDTDLDELHGIGRLVRFLGKFHVMVVHFPIALVLAAALAEMLFLLTGRSPLSEAAHFSVRLGAAGAIVAVVLGLAAAHFGHFPDEMARVLTAHRWLGIAGCVTMVLAGGCSVLSRCGKCGPGFVWPYRVLLLLSAGLVGVAGHFGAILVHGFEHFRW